jgi:hypothetical protein
MLVHLMRTLVLASAATTAGQGGRSE